MLSPPPSLANLRLVSALLRESTAILDKLGLRVVGWQERECHAVLVCLAGRQCQAQVQLLHPHSAWRAVLAARRYAEEVLVINLVSTHGICISTTR